MRLVDHPEILESWPRPTAEAPWRALISGCMAGWDCGVDGTDYGMGGALASLVALPTLAVAPFCPEDIGLGTPRTMPDIHGGDGFGVLDGTAHVLDEHGRDFIAALLSRAGIPVVSQRDARTLGLLHARLDPGFVMDAAARDHHEHPWVVENLHP